MALRNNDPNQRYQFFLGGGSQGAIAKSSISKQNNPKDTKSRSGHIRKGSKGSKDGSWGGFNVPPEYKPAVTLVRQAESRLEEAWREEDDYDAKVHSSWLDHDSSFTGNVLVVDAIEVEPVSPLMSRPFVSLQHRADKKKDEKRCLAVPFFGGNRESRKVLPSSGDHGAAGHKHRSKIKPRRYDFTHRIVASTLEWIERLQERRRSRLSEKRISTALLVLRAASERQFTNKSPVVSEGFDCEHQDEDLKGKCDLVCMMGDYGLALFAPLDETAFEPLGVSALCTEKECKSECDSTTAADESVFDSRECTELEQEVTEIPLKIEVEAQSNLRSSPPILTRHLMQQIADGGLPSTVKLMKWQRAYSLARDGDCFYTMLHKCSMFKHTVIALKTDNGDIAGGYADTPWKQQEGYNKNRSFYGSGRAFLFSTNPVRLHKDCDEEKGEKNISIFKWTGSNTYCQVCDVERGQLAMGGGGDFGLIVEDNFTNGSTGHCSTFGNPPLTSDTDGHFAIVDFEVYGFVPCLY